MKKLVPVALSLGLLIPLAACGDDAQAADATAVCVDGAGNRVDDTRCGAGDNGMNGFMWFYIMSTMNQPYVGQQVVHNTYYSNTTVNRYAGFKAPQTVAVNRGVPKTGWKPSSGNTGFVSKSKTNITPPKVIQQQNKPMYQQKGSVNKAPAPAPRPAPRR